MSFGFHTSLRDCNPIVVEVPPTPREIDIYLDSCLTCQIQLTNFTHTLLINSGIKLALNLQDLDRRKT